MSSLGNWRRHVHRVGRDLGVPAGARVPLAAALAGLAAAGLYLQRNRFKAGDLAVLAIPGGLPGGPKADVRLNVRVLKDASLFVGSFGVDGGVEVGPADAASQAGFQLLFPGTTPGILVTSANVNASSLTNHVPSLSRTSMNATPPAISGRAAPLAPGPLNITVPMPSRRITNMVLP